MSVNYMKIYFDFDINFGKSQKSKRIFKFSSRIF